MTPIENRSTRFHDGGSVAVLVVAICLSVAGLVGALLLRERHEKEARRHATGIETTQSPFTPGVKALEVISKIAEPKKPLWANDRNYEPGTTATSANHYATANSAVSNREPNVPGTQPPERDPQRNVPLSASVEVAPGATTWVPAIALAPVISTVGSSATANPSGSPPQRADAETVPDTRGTGVPPASVQPKASASAAPAAAGPPAVQCGSMSCAPGLVCCNASCGTCARPGEKCSQQVCGMPAAPTSTPCGLNTCNVGEFCCNPYCGICAASQSECDSTATCMSPVQYPQSVSCGMVTCNTGYVCCNPSCGICAPYGEPCSQDTCS